MAGGKTLSTWREKRGLWCSLSEVVVRKAVVLSFKTADGWAKKNGHLEKGENYEVAHANLDRRDESGGEGASELRTPKS